MKRSRLAPGDRLAALALALACALGCGGRKASAPAAKDGEPAAVAPPRGRSAAFHLELAGVYERHRDPATAEKEYASAIAAATSPAQRSSAYLALGRVRLARGDAAGSIEALDRAHAEERAHAAARSAARPEDGDLGPGASEDDLERGIELARLYALAAGPARAGAILDEALAVRTEPVDRERILRAWIDLFGEAGALEAEIARHEQALAGGDGEASLEFLALAYPEAPSHAAPGRGDRLDDAAAERAARVLSVQQRLYARSPGDAAARRRLIDRYAELGRADDAVALLRGGPPLSSRELALGVMTDDPEVGGVCSAVSRRAVYSGDAAMVAEVARIFLRARDRDRALAEIAALEAPRHRGTAELVLAATLYVEAGRPDRARRALAAADRAARADHERRAVALAREHVFERSGAMAELESLYARWTSSTDSCLAAYGIARSRARASVR
jgi:hypothetical protein